MRASLRMAGIAALLLVVMVPASGATVSSQYAALGVDMPGVITALVTALGAVVVAAITAWAAFLVVRKALRWVRKVG